jgi:hypothetical protein
MTRRLGSITAAALAVAAVGATATADAAVRDCQSSKSDNAYVSSARNMTCKAARRDLHRYQGSIKRHFTTPGGFHCRRVSGSRLAGQWRCVKGAKAYRFEFAD